MARQDITRAVGKVVRLRRKARKLTQEQLGFAADVNRNYISLIELGSSSPTIDILGKIAAALDLSLSSLILEAETTQQKRSAPAARRPSANGKRAPAQIMSQHKRGDY